MRYVQVSASDDRMDCRDMFHDPINPLPRKCVECGFPDLDHIPQPYFLIKSRTMSPNELALAENGNFLVRERVRRVLDLLAPGQCTYFPTYYKGTSEKTPWLLTVPNHQIVTAKVDPAIPRCAVCGEPRSAHPGTQWSESLFGRTADSDHEVMKSATWGSSEKGWDEWISRNLYLSVRLLHLLKKIKAKGFYEATCQKPVAPDREESVWIREKLRLLEAGGIPLHPIGTLSDDDTKWFCQFLKTHTRQGEVRWDIKAAEKRVKAKLPKSYISFVTTIGPMSFENIDEQAGSSASILPPTQLGVERYADELEDEESRAVNALTFATTSLGDHFCFDVQKDKNEYAVFLFKHEYNLLEPYADNFVECIRRLAGLCN